MDAVEKRARELLATYKTPNSVAHRALLSGCPIPIGSCDWDAVQAIMTALREPQM